LTPTNLIVRTSNFLTKNNSTTIGYPHNRKLQIRLRDFLPIFYQFEFYLMSNVSYTTFS
jgi:hypothetical protein